MIPKEMEANEILVVALIRDWRLEVMSTNWVGYWIIQLSRKGANPLALCIDLNKLASICSGLRACIDAAKQPSLHPGVTQMQLVVAVDLPTQINGEGAITIYSEWEAEPVVMINYYRDKRVSGKEVIRQGMHADDAMEIYNRIVGIYNNFPEKQSWSPRILS